jgi:hypothetical protein
MTGRKEEGGLAVVVFLQFYP